MKRPKKKKVETLTHLYRYGDGDGSDTRPARKPRSPNIVGMVESSSRPMAAAPSTTTSSKTKSKSKKKASGQQYTKAERAKILANARRIRRGG